MKRHAIPIPVEVLDESTFTGRAVHIDWHLVGDTEQVWLRSAWDATPIFHRIREWQPDDDSWAFTLCGQRRFHPCPPYDCPDRNMTGATTPSGTVHPPCTAHFGGPRGETVPYRFLNGRIARPCRRCFTPDRAVDLVPKDTRP